MKNLSYLIAFACTALSISSCSKTDDSSIDNGSTLTVNALNGKFDESSDSKISTTLSSLYAPSNLNLAWEEGDKIAIYTNNDSGENQFVDEFVIQGDYTANQVVFKSVNGVELTPNQKYSAVYPSNTAVSSADEACGTNAGSVFITSQLNNTTTGRIPNLKEFLKVRADFTYGSTTSLEFAHTKAFFVTTINRPDGSSALAKLTLTINGVEYISSVDTPANWYKFFYFLIDPVTADEIKIDYLVENASGANYTFGKTSELTSIEAGKSYLLGNVNITAAQ